MNVEGYEQLAAVLQDAYNQAAKGKGAARHGTGKPFHEQPMQDLIRLYGPGFALGQAGKKMQESQRMDRDAAERELLGAIVYIAGAIIAARDGAEDRKAEAVKGPSPTEISDVLARRFVADFSAAPTRRMPTQPVVQTLCGIPVGQWITRGDPLFKNGELLPLTTPLLVRHFGDLQPSPMVAGGLSPPEWDDTARGVVSFNIVGVPLGLEPTSPARNPEESGQP